MTLFNCVHSFAIEARDRDDFDRKLDRFHLMVNKASTKLEIGFVPGVMVGNRSTTIDRSDLEPTEEPILETLFDV